MTRVISDTHKTRRSSRPVPAARGLALALFLGLLAWPVGATPAGAQEHGEKAHTADKHGEAQAAHDEHAAGHGEDEHAYRQPNALEHVVDDKHGAWHLFDKINPRHLHLPNILGFQITKFMILELFAAGAVILCYVPLARRLQSGETPRGWLQNSLEVLLTFVRDDIAKPNIGGHDVDKYVPFLWTLFLFVLFNNLLGMFPFFGSATGSIYVTLGLAVVAFFAIHGSAISKMGFGHYVGSLWPHIDVPFPMGLFIKPLVFVLEVVGVLVRNVVLAVRLFANMFAGHVVLATILIFIHVAGMTGSDFLWGGVTLTSVLGMVALSLLELFVAFLQAFIFTFLTSLFMGMALHPAH